MLVYKIWWVNCDERHWEEEETGKEKKQRSVEVSQLLLSESVGITVVPREIEDNDNAKFGWWE